MDGLENTGDKETSREDEGWRYWRTQGTKKQAGRMRDGGIGEHRGQKNKQGSGGMIDEGIGVHMGRRKKHR